MPGKRSVYGINSMNSNNKEYYKKIQPKLHNNRRKRTNLNYRKKIDDFDKFSCRWKRSLKDCLGCDGKETYCVGDGTFCQNKNNKQYCSNKGKVLQTDLALKNYWTQAPNFIGDTSLRTCSGTPNDYSLTQDSIKNKCSNLYKTHKDETEGWIYNINHVNRSNNRRINTKQRSNNNIKKQRNNVQKILSNKKKGLKSTGKKLW